MPTPVFLTGFEHGALPFAGGTTALYDTTGAANLSIVTTPVNSGTYALRIATTAAIGVAGWTVTGDRLVGRLYIYFPTALPAATVGLALILDAGSAVAWRLRFNQATTKFQMAWDATNPQDSAATIAADTWYRIDFDVLLNAATRTR